MVHHSPPIFGFWVADIFRIHSAIHKWCCKWRRITPKASL